LFNLDKKTSKFVLVVNFAMAQNKTMTLEGLFLLVAFLLIPLSHAENNSAIRALTVACQKNGELNLVFDKLKQIPNLNKDNNSAWIIKEVMDIRGSGRRFYRITRRENGKLKSYIVMRFNDSRADNLNFVKATDFLQSHGVKVPKVFAHEKLEGSEEFLLLEDFGDQLLKRRVEENPQNIESDYKAVLREAAKMHKLKESELAGAPLEPPFNFDYYLWEQDLFREKLLEKAMGLSAEKAHKLLPEAEQKSFIEKIASQERFLLHRDFQSENILFPTPHSPGFIDYQGMRLGRPEYDIASLLYDPYVSIAPNIRENLLKNSFERLKKIKVLPQNLKYSDWKHDYFAPAASQRLMQALGAYGRLSTEGGKPEYAQYIPIARARLLEVLQMAGAFKELQDYLQSLPKI
jgi:aminoglycoside/choline kinase family phosphotransferase